MRQGENMDAFLDDDAFQFRNGNEHSELFQNQTVLANRSSCKRRQTRRPLSTVGAV
jgi:hypothetical protein